jgi:hypothetical protein
VAQTVNVPPSTEKINWLGMVWKLGVVLFSVLTLLIILRLGFFSPYHDHYYYQAVSWLNGRLDINNAPDTLPDIVTYKGNRHLPLGVFPAVLTLPFVFVLGNNYGVFYLFIPLVGISVWLAWQILAKLKVAYTSTHIWLVILFFLSTVYLSCAIRVDGAWFLAHLVTTVFTFAAVNETLGKQRVILIGLFLGMAAATRFSVLFTFPFYLWLLAVKDDFAFQSTVPKEQKLQFENFKTVALRYILLGVGLAIPMIFYFGNNYLRFGSFMESGYNLALLSPKDSLYLAREQGLFGLVHVPKNLFYFLLATPEPFNPNWNGVVSDAPFLVFPYIKPSAWGMSIFLTTPTIIYLFRASLRRPFVQACWMAILLTAVPVMTYYGVGWVQFGFRYAMDFTPFIWLIIIYVLREKEIISNKPSLAFWLIVLGCIINLWGSYWLLAMTYDFTANGTTT